MHGKILSLAGAYEFIKENASPTTSAKSLAGLAKAFSLMSYSAGFVAPNEAQALQNANATLPQGFVVASENAQTKIVTTKDFTTGIVFFPMLSPRTTKASSDAIQSVAKAARELRAQNVDLIVGLSPWGAQIEREYLDAGNRDVDVLLGSGQGFGFNARPMSGSHVLWARGFSKGKVMDSIEILQVPSNKETWKPRKNFNAQAIRLEDSIPGDPKISKLF